MLVLTVTGLIVGVVVSEREHSDRRARDAQARLIERQAEVAQVARVNLVSGMASALAHEINQPMTAARALARSAQHLLRTPGSDLTRADGNLSTMVAHIDHAGDIVRRMRNFIRRGHPHVSTINVRGMIEEALTLAYAEASTRHVRIEIDAPDDLPDIHGDSVQLEQVVLNLVHNAVDAIAVAGRPHGHVRVVARGQSAPPADRDRRAGQWARHRRPTRGEAVRPVDHVEAGWPGIWVSRSAPRSWRRTAAASGCTPANRARRNSASRCRSTIHVRS